jgi:hypothetical protein
VSELPDHPDLNQLRRQARELLRAATEGDPHALTRLRAVSERVTLSAAQLAVAREYGFPSWPALRTEADHRRRMSESAARPPYRYGNGRAHGAEDRWSFGGATAIQITAGVLSPGALVIGPGHAVLDVSLMPSQETHPAHSELLPFDDVVVADDQGTRYALSFESGSIPSKGPGQVREPMELRLGLDPVPARECSWLELRGQDGSATRLLPSARPGLRVGRLAPAAGSPAERELSEQALSLIQLHLAGVGQDAETEDVLSRRCSAALARTAQIRQSGQLDIASELPDQLARLCAALTGQHPAVSLPRAWSDMLDAAQRTDGSRHHLDIATDLPPVDGTAVQLDSLISEPGTWRVYLRARPGWWKLSADHRRKWAAMSVHAEDNLGGMYLSTFGGSTGHSDYEELALRFLPRLDPLAHALKLTFAGAADQIAVEVRLPPPPEQDRNDHDEELGTAL